ncbi:hypothetical protein [Pseudomonas sp. RL]|uniref:hypothetical protein n=1 Tax=Pseudomonas sp. RL TaxID=1452718 RepID=UPI000483355E|nr:hypothetical protein [Pseudomonas sp. RL]
MSDYLGAVLRGLESGSRIGLGAYEMEQRIAREKRLDDRQAQRDAIADQQWTQTYDLNVQQQNDARTFREGQLGLMRDAHNLLERKYGDARADKARIEHIQRMEGHAQRLFTGDDGLPVTNAQALAQKINASQGRDLNLLLDLAVERGLIPAERRTHYKGGEVMVGPNGGLVIRLEGKSGEGKPITDKAYLSERGTSDPDDPIMEIPVHALGQMALGDQYVAAQRAVTLGAERLQAQRVSLSGLVDDQVRRAGGTPEHIAALEAELAQAEAGLSAADAEVGLGRAALNAKYGNKLFGEGGMVGSGSRGLTETPEGYAARLRAEAQGVVDAKRAGLSAAQSQRPLFEAAAEQQLGDFQQRERSARLSLGDAGYLAGVAAEPAARAKRAEQATKFRGDLAKSVANAVHINKDDQEAISKADLMAAINALDPAILDMAAERGDAQGAVMRAAQDMVRFGMNGGLEGFIMAQAQGIPAQAYAEAYAQLTDKDPQLRAQKALMLAQRGAAR